jgi:hypothetical protein
VLPESGELRGALALLVPVGALDPLLFAALADDTPLPLPLVELPLPLLLLLPLPMFPFPLELPAKEVDPTAKKTAVANRSAFISASSDD